MLDQEVYGFGTMHIGQELMCTLTIGISMSISFFIFQMFILYTLSMRVRNYCIACTELARQELMRQLSILVRDHSESIL